MNPAPPCLGDSRQRRPSRPFFLILPFASRVKRPSACGAVFPEHGPSSRGHRIVVLSVFANAQLVHRPKDEFLRDSSSGDLLTPFAHLSSFVAQDVYPRGVLPDFLEIIRFFGFIVSFLLINLSFRFRSSVGFRSMSLISLPVGGIMKDGTARLDYIIAPFPPLERLVQSAARPGSVQDNF